jgi:hypothetical protein
MSKLEKVPAKFSKFLKFLQVPTALPADVLSDSRSSDNKIDCFGSGEKWTSTVACRLQKSLSVF